MIKINLIFLLIIFSSFSCAEKTKYTREECIVRVNINWEGVPLGDKESLIKSLMDTVKSAPDMGFNKTPASSAVQGEDREFIYYQHKYDCENRIINMENLIKYSSKHIAGLPTVEVDRGNFLPGPYTIRVKGPSWVD
jgi:hypothetical protein